MKTKLHELAKKYQKNSHAPYSKAHIAAAVEMEDGTIYGGCNIENASYGGTVCAERVAIWKAISETGNQKIKQILVLSPQSPAWPPCGMCRQVMAEFSHPDTVIYLASPEKIEKTLKMTELFPFSFTSDFL